MADLVIFEYPADASEFLPLIALFEERGAQFIPLFRGVYVVVRDDAGFGMEHSVLPALKTRQIPCLASQFFTFFTTDSELRGHLLKAGAREEIERSPSDRYLLLAHAPAMPEWLRSEGIPLVPLVEAAMLVAPPDSRQAASFLGQLIDDLSAAGAGFALLPLRAVMATRADWTTPR